MIHLFSLAGRVALVTGASGGIGSVLARGLAGAGAQVIVSGRDQGRLDALAGEIRAAGGVAESIPADLRQADEVPRLADAALALAGHVDVLVNCAGMNRRMPIGSVTPAIYDEIMNVNLRSAYFLTQAIAPQMAERGGGKIINIGSITVAVGLAEVSVYGMSKSALAQLTRTMAVEWAEHNIQVNCLCPGFIHTDLTGPLWANTTRRQWILDRVPMKRGGTPEDLVGLAIYLAAPASDYMTGQSIFVDGGFTAGSQW